MKAFNALVRCYADKIRVLLVYIQEAHATDTWPLGLPISFETTHTVEDRADHCARFLDENEFPHRAVVDAPPASLFNATFASWPLRFYIFDQMETGARLSYQCEPDGDSVSVSDIHRYLSRRFPTEA